MNDQIQNDIQESETEKATAQVISRTSLFQRWVWTLLLIGIFTVGAYFRFIGIDWDNDHHLHPDERFLTMVSTAVSPVKNLGEFFNTAESSLNPNNRGYGFYVYGTLPLFIVRYIAEWVNQTGYSEVYIVGRYLSGLFDLMVVGLVYLIALHLYRKERLALLASAFYAVTVLPIQLSHFYAVDTFTNFFALLAFYFAIKVAYPDQPISIREIKSPQNEGETFSVARFILKNSWIAALSYAFFGIALGMAMASKVSVAPLAIILPIAAFFQYLNLSDEDRPIGQWIIIRNLVLGALLTFITFRICQPFAFTGPGFFGITPNPRWIDSLKDLSAQSGGDVDFPPALQWARRPLWFAWENMVNWGMGLPLGLLAWAGFLLMAWRILKGEWQKHLLIWGWTAAYFTWQEISFTRAMRYQLPVYPLLVILAAWAIFYLWDHPIQFNVSNFSNTVRKRINVDRWSRGIIYISAGFVLISTTAYAYAFTRIYTRPVTRVAASYWIYQNVPGPINITINTEDGEFNQVLPYELGATISEIQPAIMAFQPRSDGLLKEIKFAHVVSEGIAVEPKVLYALVSKDVQGANLISSGSIAELFTPTDDPRGKEFRITFEIPAELHAGETYFLTLRTESAGSTLNLAGPISIGIFSNDNVIYQGLPDPVKRLKSSDNSFELSFKPLRSGTIERIYFPWIVDWENQPDEKNLQITLTSTTGGRSTAEIMSTFAANPRSPRGEPYSITFNPPLKVGSKETCSLRLEMEGMGALAFYGSKPAHESSWDDVLPLSIDGYSPFDYHYGVYRSELNFEMYWDDNEIKRERFQANLDQADYIFISSNRQWGTTSRVPERYPLTSVYYRHLLGCPDDKTITWCYSVAEPGQFKGDLGFDLVQVFQSDPNLGSLRFNTQFAEEAFTVYDHPKVLIFKKNDRYDPDKVQAILNSVDLSQVIHLIPGKAGSAPGNLMLPYERLTQQRSGGTWSELFQRESIINKYPALTLIIWYVVVTLLGWIVYPFVRLALGGLPDKGYPLVRLVGMLLLAYFSWLAGSIGIPFTRLTIASSAILLFILNIPLLLLQQKILDKEFKERGRYYLTIEILSLAFFLIFLFIRLGNPDLWHPYKGGEKPMDFSYFNAVIKSSSFPPFDPWFAGGYINYYYYGFVIVGVLVKALGIMPSIAYNLILPTLFSAFAMGAFSLGWNILKRRIDVENEPSDKLLWGLERVPLLTGLAAAIGSLILGNLGTVRMIWHGLQKLAAPGGNIETATVIQRWLWSFEGFGKFLSGSTLPYGAGDWYWIPSRTIPAEPITEFPFFTFLYADPHAHLIALPITILALCWALSILLGRWQWGITIKKYAWLEYLLSFILGGITIGALRPVNTWDLPTYLALSVVIIFYTAIKYGEFSRSCWHGFTNPVASRWLAASLSALFLIVLSFAFYLPYAQWYSQGYNTIDPWDGGHTPFWSYLTHWGLFLFIIFSWMIWEAIDWMANTPVSSLNALRPYRNLLKGVLGAVLVLVIAFIVKDIQVGWITLLVAMLSAILILRPTQSDEKRFVLFCVGTAMVLTLAVELIVLKGDIGRMNTVFKFYLQAWTLLSISAAAALAWIARPLLAETHTWWKSAWQIMLIFLVAGAALFPVLAGNDKIRDRMAANAPHTLDGMEYMAYAHYNDSGVDMDLSEDFRAIQWMQDNIIGSPVIVEGNTPEYRWGSRFTIYTGLPGVVGWNWHQRQQRATTPSEWVTNRVEAIKHFYTTSNQNDVINFLNRYDVEYIIVGQLEAINYPAEGLEKFDAWNGILWKSVYQEGQTTIYKVLK